jgi:RNA polymerase sigma-70 factor (ECF subfamily)
LTQEPVNQLVKRCQDGDPLAQHRLFHQYVKAMFNTALRLTGNELDAEDAVQEGFIKAFSKMHQYRFEGSFGGWLKRIIINSALDRMRRKPPEFASLDIADELEEKEDDTWGFLPGPAVVNSEILKLPAGCRVMA